MTEVEIRYELKHVYDGSHDPNNRLTVAEAMKVADRSSELWQMLYTK